MKTVVLDGYTTNPGDLSWDAFKEFGELEVYERTSFSRDEQELVVERAKDADVILTNKTPITKETIEQLPTLKYIGVLATGFDVIDLKVASEKGIVVTNIPSYGTEAVAQMTFALLLELCHHVGSHNDSVKNGDWTNNDDWCYWNYPLVELQGKTMGIIGYGRIGQAVGKIAQAFGMKVITTTRGDRPTKKSSGDVEYVDKNLLIKESDVISLHCPLTDETRELINEQTLNQMRKEAFIINTARGPLINDEDLKQALNAGEIAGAAVDVVSIEPIESTNPLLEAENCIITPHISWAPKESRNRLLDIAYNNINAFLNNEPVNVVNQ